MGDLKRSEVEGGYLDAYTLRLLILICIFVIIRATHVEGTAGNEAHVEEAWINLDTVQIGYEISFNKYFYQHKPLRAIDPKTGKIAWEHKEKFPLWAGTLTTAGGLLITGTSDGFVKAFDAKNGKELWKFQTGSGVVSVPITWEMDGEQYIGIQSGYGGAVPLWGGDLADLTKQVTQGGSMWVFKLPKASKN